MLCPGIDNDDAVGIKLVPNLVDEPGESEPIEKFPEIQGQQFRKGSVIEFVSIIPFTNVIKKT